MDPYNLIIKICLNAIPLVLAITLHEAAHGYVARMFGDNTAYMLGRVTLNPAKHIDPVGTIAFPLLSMAITHRLPIPTRCLTCMRNPFPSTS